MVVLKYKNMHIFLNAWEFGEDEVVPRDTEDLSLFLMKHNLTAKFENMHGNTVETLSLSRFTCVIGAWRKGVQLFEACKDLLENHNVRNAPLKRRMHLNKSRTCYVNVD